MTIAKDFSEFFEQVSPLTDFNEIVRQDSFQEIPDSSIVIIADIQGSTQAISEGRYKDVNTLGAACIAAAKYVAGETSISYIFGGDGATIIIPPSLEDSMRKTLSEIILMAEEDFNITLRVGLVPVKPLF